MSDHSASRGAFIQHSQLMNYYRVKVQIESNDGEQLMLQTERNFSAEKDVFIFASGFADGFAMAFKGAVLEKQIEKLDDDRTR